MDNRNTFQGGSGSFEQVNMTAHDSRDDGIRRPRVASLTRYSQGRDPLLLQESSTLYASSAPNVVSISNENANGKSVPPTDDPKTEEEESWFILLVVTPSNMLLGMFWIAFPIFYIEFSEYFGTSKGAAGWIGSLQNGLQQFLGIITSSPIEIYGCRIVALVGSIIVTMGIAASAFAPNILYLYCTYGIVTGIGLSMLNLCCQVIVQQHFNRNRSIATAISMIGKSMGLVFGPIIVQYLIDAFGWRGALLVFSAIFLNTFALACGFRPPKHSKKKARGFKEVIKKIFDFSMLSDITFVLFCAGFVLFKFNNMAFYRQLPSRMVHEGMDRHSAALLLSIAGVCSIIARFVSGIIGNFKRVNRTLYYSLAIFISGIASCALVFGISFIYTSIFSGINGFAQGTTTLMANVVLVDLFGVDKIARTKGLFNVFAAIPGFLATPITGWIFDFTGNYNIPFLVVGVMAIIGAFLSLCVYFIHKRKQQKQETTL